MRGSYGVWLWLGVLGLAGASGVRAEGEAADKAGALARLPVREVTIFKDGHALLLHEGRMPVAADGTVTLDALPNPVLGTFWPYSRDKATPLTGVTAAAVALGGERDAISVAELIEANVGAEVTITGVDGKEFEARIVSVPQVAGDVPNGAGYGGGGFGGRAEYANGYGGGYGYGYSGGGAGSRVAGRAGGIVLLQRGSQTLALEMAQIRNVAFKGAFHRTLPSGATGNRLTLAFDWKNGKPGANADIGMLYVQKGLRWIPQYKVTLDGKGGATARMQATLVNEIADLKDVTVHLVVGVPQFAFQETPDPIGMQDTFARLSRYFQTGSDTGNALSNALMGQGAGGFGPMGRAGEARGGLGGGGGDAPAGPDPLQPLIESGTRGGDYTVYTVPHVTLARGQRMVLTVAEWKVTYQDVYTLDLPPIIPGNTNSGPQNEGIAAMLRQAERPRVQHILRIHNAGKLPITTAPALLMKGDQVLAQSLMGYTPPGGDADVALTAAVDVSARRQEQETGRRERAIHYNDHDYTQVDLEGRLTLQNFGMQPVVLEVSRYLVGKPTAADHEGKVEMLNGQGDDDTVRVDLSKYNLDRYDYWWRHFNGLGRLVWRPTLKAGEKVDLGYTWAITLY